jgi:hypothetical protein
MHWLYVELQNRIVEELKAVELGQTEPDAFVAARDLYNCSSASENGESFNTWLKRIKKDVRIRTKSVGGRRLQIHAGDYIRVTGEAANFDFEAVEEAAAKRASRECQLKERKPTRYRSAP